MDRLTNEIAAGLKLGSRKAWTRLYEIYAEHLWREVSRLVGGNSADTADIVQEVFLAAAKSAENFDPEKGSVWMWLIGIARNKVALRVRREMSQLENARRWWASLNGSARQWLAGSADAPAKILESKELASLVRTTLLELSTEHHIVLTKKYLDGLAVKQIAFETNSTDEAVRAKLMRARRAFREKFSRLAYLEPNVSTGQGVNHG